MDDNGIHRIDIDAIIRYRHEQEHPGPKIIGLLNRYYADRTQRDGIKAQVRDIGWELNQSGGTASMNRVADEMWADDASTPRHMSTLDKWWNGIGDWLS